MMSDHKQGNPLTRREALRRMGNGFGMMAFASAVSQSLVKAGVSTPDGSVMVGKARLSATGQACHLPLHERWVFDDRLLRSKARP